MSGQRFAPLTLWWLRQWWRGLELLKFLLFLISIWVYLDLIAALQMALKNHVSIILSPSECFDNMMHFASESVERLSKISSRFVDWVGNLIKENWFPSIKRDGAVCVWKYCKRPLKKKSSEPHIGPFCLVSIPRFSTNVQRSMNESW